MIEMVHASECGKRMWACRRWCEKRWESVQGNKNPQVWSGGCGWKLPPNHIRPTLRSVLHQILQHLLQCTPTMSSPIYDTTCNQFNPLSLLLNVPNWLAAQDSCEQRLQYRSHKYLATALFTTCLAVAQTMIVQFSATKSAASEPGGVKSWLGAEVSEVWRVSGP
jgi:hypothetical protein